MVSSFQCSIEQNNLLPAHLQSAICKFEGSKAAIVRCYLPFYGYKTEPGENTKQEIWKQAIREYPKEFAELFKVSILPNKFTSPKLALELEKKLQNNVFVELHTFNTEQAPDLVPAGFLLVETVENYKVATNTPRNEHSFFLVAKNEYQKKVVNGEKFSCKPGQYSQVEVEV